MAKLSEFALGLDGVTGVIALSDDPANVANPFSADADGAVGIQMLDDDWADDIDDVSASVQEWMDSHPTQGVSLRAGIVTPFGGVALSNSSVTTQKRVDFFTQLATDELLDGAAVGFQFDYINGDDEPFDIALQRAPGASLDQIVSRWHEQIEQFAPANDFTVFADTEVQIADQYGRQRDLRPYDPADGARRLTLDTSPAGSDLELGSIDALDAMPDITGWTVESLSTGSVYVTIAITPGTDSGGVESGIRALPGFDPEWFVEFAGD